MPRESPDQVVVHAPQSCGGCGADLAAAPVIGVEARQCSTCRAIALQVIEHRAEPRACGCGQVTTGLFPAHASAATCYGPGVAALGAYLLGCEHLPVQRAAECLAEAFGAPVSTGWLAWLLPSAAAGLDGFLAIARQALTGAPVAHFDETGARVAARLNRGARGLQPAVDGPAPGRQTGQDRHVMTPGSCPPSPASRVERSRSVAPVGSSGSRRGDTG